MNAYFALRYLQDNKQKIINNYLNFNNSTEKSLFKVEDCWG